MSFTPFKVHDLVRIRKSDDMFDDLVRSIGSTTAVIIGIVDTKNRRRNKPYTTSKYDIVYLRDALLVITQNGLS